MPEPVFFQAHRGAIDERPENTMVALRHAWQFPGAIPEVDLRTTRDGVMICLHNPTLAATTNAPASIKDTPVSELTYEEISRCDAGITFAPEYAGTQVPRFTDVLALMAEQPGRQLYPDLKEVDLAALKALIDRYDLEARMIFTHGDQAYLQDLIKRFPQGQTMTWCSGSPTRIKARFAALASSNFAGIDYLQFHWPSERSGDQLTYFRTAAHGGEPVR
jgi:glycerophosphoryl diester phosphodiesterase